MISRNTSEKESKQAWKINLQQQRQSKQSSVTSRQTVYVYGNWETSLKLEQDVKQFVKALGKSIINLSIS